MITEMNRPGACDAGAGNTDKSAQAEFPAIAPKKQVVLRPCQAELVKGVYAQMRCGVSRIALQLPTGGGKTVIFTRIVADAARKGAHVLILAHRQEILEQICAALERLGVAYGVIAAGAAETDDNVQVASVATIVRRLDRWRDQFDLLIVDEAHHAVAGSWAKVIESQPRAKLLGVTATPERLDGRGLIDVFDVMICGPSVAELMELGYLSRAKVFAPDAAVDMTGAKIRAGDFAVEDVRARMDGLVIGAAVDEYKRLCAGVPAVAFCVDIEHSQQVAARFQEAGIRAAHVDGETASAERRAMIAALGAGELDVLTNCGLVSEGVDVPIVGAAILLRPTASLALHLQQVGRVLRPAPAKEHAYILDFVGNTSRHGLPDAPRAWSLESKPRRERKGMGEPVVRRCEDCGALNPAAAHQCSECLADLRTPRERAEIEIRLREAEEARVADQIREMRYPQRLEWAGDDEDRLRTVASACGYKKGWVFHVLSGRGAQ